MTHARRAREQPLTSSVEVPDATAPRPELETKRDRPILFALREKGTGLRWRSTWHQSCWSARSRLPFFHSLPISVVYVVVAPVR